MNKEYKIGGIEKALVTGMEPYGIFVELEDGYTGLIHISEISTGFVKNITDFAKIGDKIYVKVLNIDDDNRQLKLSIKDFDYKNNNQKRREKIIETENGFKPLEENLNNWIEEKLKEIEQN